MGFHTSTGSSKSLGTAERLPLVVLIGLTALAFVAATILSRVDRSLDVAAGSPEAVVAAYIDAVIDGDGASARRLLAPAELLDVRLRPCDEFADFAEHDVGFPFDRGDVRVALRAVTISAQVADVRVTTEVRSNADLFDPGWDADTTFRLRLVEVSGVEEWRLIQVPWPFEVCR